jgi:acylphosphatase
VTDQSEPSRRLEAVVRGRVQGVGYRYHAARAAARHAIVGWVANEWGGTVRAVGEGTQAKLEAWLAELREGPRGGLVEHVDEHWSAATGTFEDFDVRTGYHRGD